jgi:hypothetical protein
MPFTIAHIAAALPFRKTRFKISAVVIGSMAPDFEYFLRLAPQGRFGHTPLGLVTFTLPVALAVLWLYHKTVKPAVVKLLPVRIQQRLESNCGEFRFGGGKQFAMLVIAILAGALTHLLWDSFTHYEGWPVEHWALLSEPVTIPWLRPYPLYVFKLLQHVSTVIGMGILAVWFIGWFRRTKPAQTLDSQLSPGSKLRVVASLLLLAFCGALLRVASVHPQQHSVVSDLGVFAATSIALLWWQMVLLGTWWRRGHIFSRCSSRTA